MQSVPRVRMYLKITRCSHCGLLTGKGVCKHGNLELITVDKREAIEKVHDKCPLRGYEV